MTSEESVTEATIIEATIIEATKAEISANARDELAAQLAGVVMSYQTAILVDQLIETHVRIAFSAGFDQGRASEAAKCFRDANEEYAS